MISISIKKADKVPELLSNLPLHRLSALVHKGLVYLMSL